jgi:hypothetical protein
MLLARGAHSSCATVDGIGVHAALTATGACLKAFSSGCCLMPNLQQQPQQGSLLQQ